MNPPVDPNVILSTPAPELPGSPTIPSDPLAQTELWRELQLKGAQGTLTPEEIAQMVAVTRALRRTNTGPAKAKTSKAGTKTKKAVSDADILSDDI
jgi:hypothetical protein